MNIQIRAYQSKDAASAAQIWNEVVTDGNAFPQDTEMTANVANLFFQEQTYTGIAENADTHEILGLYILHPNNVGRCGHICNASYAVRKNIRGLHIGEKLVLDCLQKAKENQFRIRNLMRLLLPTPQHYIFMNELDSKNSAQYPAVSGCRMELMKTSFHITIFSKYIPLHNGGRAHPAYPRCALYL